MKLRFLLGKGSTIYFTINKSIYSKPNHENCITSRPATSDRIQTLQYRGKNILHLDYSNLSEKQYLKANQDIEKYLCKLNKNNLLILTDITGDHISIDALKNSKKMSESIKKYVKKNAVIGLSTSHSVFLKAMKYFTDLNIKSFDTEEEALEWLTD